jgi:recombination protein RecT
MSTNVSTTQNNQPAVAKNIQQLLQSDMVKGRLQEILGKRSSTFATAVIQIANSNDLLKKAEPTSIKRSTIINYA